jgi:hypothetical protein
VFLISRVAKEKFKKLKPKVVLKNLELDLSLSSDSNSDSDSDSNSKPKILSKKSFFDLLLIISLKTKFTKKFRQNNNVNSFLKYIMDLIKPNLKR